jgi:hypothetical protein
MDEMGPRWPDFFIAEVGATAALTGLIIVAVSINLQRILAIKYLPGRALEALMLLMAALLIASVALIPAQRLLLLGCEILLIEGVALLTSVVLQMQAMKADIPRQGARTGRAVAVALTGVPMLVGGSLLVGGHTEGFYWIAPGILIAIAAAVMTTWVLLIEILR